MNKISFFIFFGWLCLLSFSASAQNAWFDKYMDFDDVTAVEATPELFNLMADVEGEDFKLPHHDQSFITALKNVEHLIVVNADSEEMGGMIRKDFKGFKSDSSFEKCFQMIDEQHIMKMYKKSSETDEQIQKLVLFIRTQTAKDDLADQSMLLVLDGKMKQNTVDYFKEMMKISPHKKEMSEK